MSQSAQNRQDMPKYVSGERLKGQKVLISKQIKTAFVIVNSRGNLITPWDLQGIAT